MPLNSLLIMHPWTNKKIEKSHGFLLGLFFVLSACVPKAQYEEQQSQLQETKSKLRESQMAQQECDPESFAQLKDQTQSLDILTQELIDRNTELSREVTRLRSYEVKSKNSDLTCAQKVAEGAKELEGRLARTRETYDDLVGELKGRIRELEKENLRLKKLTSKNEDPPVKPKATPKKK